MFSIPFENQTQNQLLSVLIALARATEGNDHLLSISTDKALIEGILALADLQRIPSAIERSETERARLIPDCFHCAAPCGKNSLYDIQNILTNREEVRTIKSELLSSLYHLADRHHEAALEGKYRFLFLQVLFALGRDDWEESFYRTILSEIQEVI